MTEKAPDEAELESRAAIRGERSPRERPGVFDFSPIGLAGRPACGALRLRCLLPRGAARGSKLGAMFAVDHQRDTLRGIWLA